MSRWGRPVKFADTPEQDAQAEETLRQAAHAAGFKEVDFELEPVAAALDYEQSISRPQNVVIFDFGGGTLDIAVMRLGDRDGRRKRQVYASGGRGHCRERLRPVDHPETHAGAFRPGAGQPPARDPGNDRGRTGLDGAARTGHAAEPAYARESHPGGSWRRCGLKALQALIYNDLAFTFYNRVEAAKIALSEQGATAISLEDRNIPLWELYTRSQFEADIREYTGQVERTLLDTLASSNLGTEEVDAVVKTGGSSSIPLFTEMLVRLFGAEKVKTSNAFSSVVAGLAIRAGE